MNNDDVVKEKMNPLYMEYLQEKFSENSLTENFSLKETSSNGAEGNILQIKETDFCQGTP